MAAVEDCERRLGAERASRCGPGTDDLNGSPDALKRAIRLLRRRRYVVPTVSATIRTADDIKRMRASSSKPPSALSRRPWKGARRQCAAREKGGTSATTR